jgi:hypothetical protein
MAIGNFPRCESAKGPMVRALRESYKSSSYAIVSLVLQGNVLWLPEYAHPVQCLDHV